MRTTLPLILSLFILLSSCKQKSYIREQSLPSHPNEITIAGAYALTPLVKFWISEFQKSNPRVRFELNTIGSGRGVAEILQGRTDIAMVSSELARGIDSSLWVIPVARLAVVPIFNSKNPYLTEIKKKGLTRDDLITLFSGTGSRSWGDFYGSPGKDPVKVFIRSDPAGASDVLGKYLWLKPSDIKGIGIDGEDKLMEAVKKEPLALGYCNFIQAFDPKSMNFYPEISVVPIDLNNDGKIEHKENFYDSVPHLQRAMWYGMFPCTLNRDLYLVMKDKPNTKEVVDFLKWILTEGQKSVANQGYIELHSSEVQNCLNALK